MTEEVLVHLVFDPYRIYAGEGQRVTGLRRNWLPLRRRRAASPGPRFGNRPPAHVCPRLDPLGALSQPPVRQGGPGPGVHTAPASADPPRCHPPPGSRTKPS